MDGWIWLPTSSPVRPAQGCSPYENISHNNTPNDQTSEDDVNFRKFMHSGAHLSSGIKI